MSDGEGRQEQESKRSCSRGLDKSSGSLPPLCLARFAPSLRCEETELTGSRGSGDLLDRKGAEVGLSLQGFIYEESGDTRDGDRGPATLNQSPTNK